MFTDRLRLDGRVAIVTGGSRGLGAASAIGLAEQGADLVLGARTPETLAEVAGQITALGRRAEVVTADLNDLSTLARLTETAMDTFGRIDIVVNNVGGTTPRPFLDTKTRHVEEAFRFNVLTAYELTLLAAPALLASGNGSVINIASTMGRLRDRGFVAYATAKAAMVHMSRSLAADLAPKVRVNVVAPGAILTDALETVLNEEMRNTMVSYTPMRRLGKVSDIADAVVFLASDAAGYMTGKMLEVDGGIETPNLPLGLPDL
jgi:7-alpha-hydroxysteroid dehydrogenase